MSAHERDIEYQVQLSTNAHQVNINNLNKAKEESVQRDLCTINYNEIVTFFMLHTAQFSIYALSMYSTSIFTPRNILPVRLIHSSSSFFFVVRADIDTSVSSIASSVGVWGPLPEWVV